MPPIFAPASPLGTAASIGVGAGQADVIEKNLPTLARIYEGISNSLASRGGGGGHGGGGYGNNGYIQVLPQTGGGALAQVEQQANREQHALDLGFEYGQDPVSKHIALQNQGRLDLLKQRMSQDPNAPEQPAAQPPPQWGQADEDAMLEANQVIAKTDKEVGAGNLAPENANALKAPYQDKIAMLTQKQQAFQDWKDKQAEVAAVKQAAKVDGLNATRTQNRANWEQTPADEIPGMPKRHYSLDSKGEWKLDNGPERVQHQRNFAAANERADKAAETVKLRDDVAKEKADKQRGDLINHHYGEVIKDMHKWDAEILNSNKEKPAWYQNPKEEAKRRVKDVLDLLNEGKMGPGEAPLPPGSAGLKSPGIAQPHEESTGPIVPPSPQLAQHQTQRADAMVEKIRSYGLPADHTAEIVAAINGLKELNAAHGGNLNGAPKEAKDLAQRYRATLLKYKPQPAQSKEYTNPDAKTAQALASGGY